METESPVECSANAILGAFAVASPSAISFSFLLSDACAYFPISDALFSDISLDIDYPIFGLIDPAKVGLGLFVSMK